MPARRWQLIISIALTIGVVILAVINRYKVFSAFSLLAHANLVWIAAAMSLELASFFISSRVYAPALHSLGYRLSMLRLWAMTLVAIVLSQSFPAGGVASYAFLVQAFRRKGVASGHAALLASLEALSYATAMILLFCFSLFFITFKEGLSAAGGPSLIAAVVAVLVISTAIFVLTRSQESLQAWLLRIKNGVARLLRRRWSDEPINRIVGDLSRGRALITEQPRQVALLVCLQILALTGHSLTMLAVLHSLGETTSIFVVMASFGIALVSSTFNVLPGGGGTVETAIAVALQSLGVSEAAITAAVIFRLLNFWLLTPVAFVFYRWLIHGGEPATEQATAE
jgi:uncharacterized protein (TIRG00374 family)